MSMNPQIQKLEDRLRILRLEIRIAETEKEHARVVKPAPKPPFISCEGAQSISDFADATVFAKKATDVWNSWTQKTELSRLSELRLALSNLRDQIVFDSRIPVRETVGVYIANAIHLLNLEVDRINRSR